MPADDEPIRQLEPANLLEPTNLLEPWSAEEGASYHTILRDQAPARRPIGTSPNARLGSGPAGTSRRPRRLGLLTAGAVVCLLIGAALPSLALRMIIGPVTKPPVEYTQSTPSAATTAAQPSKPSQDTSASSSATNLTGAPSGPTAAGAAAMAVPCTEQTWPNYDPGCLKSVSANV